MPKIPARAKHTHEALEQIFGHSDPGLYFIVIEDGVFDDTMQHHLDGFFRSLPGQFYSKTSEPRTTAPLRAEILELIRDSQFRETFQGMDYQLTPQNLGEGRVTLMYSANGVTVPPENPSHQQLYRLLCLANDALESKSSFFGFLYDGARFDEGMTGRFDFIFSQLNKKIVDRDNMIVFFYNDDRHLSFSKEFLRKSLIFHRIARLVAEGAVPLLPYVKCAELVRHKSERIIASKVPVAFFLGAGASVDAGMPSGEAVLDMALREYLGTEYTNREEAKEKFRAKMGNPDWLEVDQLASEHVISQLARAEANFTLLLTVTSLIESNEACHSTEAYRRLVEFCLRKKNALILTTNFDTVLERNFDGVEAVFKDEDLDKLARLDLDQMLRYFSDRGKIGLIKLHGSLDSPLSIKIKWEDLQRLPATKQAIWGRILNPHMRAEERDAVAALPVFFIGYGFHDPDLLPLIQSLRMPAIQLIPVAPEPSLAMYSLAAENNATRSEPQIIDLDFESFMDAFAVR